MPRHDYICPHCHTLLLDQYRSILEGAQRRRPDCPSCGYGVLMDWIPAASFDLRSDGSEGFAKFTIYDGQNRRVEIDSLHKLRQVERESEQQYRNGEGQPLRFRMWNQDRSNRDVNSFGPDPSEKPSTEGKRKWGLRGATKASTTEPAGEFGPAVNESNCSALTVDPT